MTVTAAWSGEHLASTVISMADYFTVSKQFYLVSIAAQSTYPGGTVGATLNTSQGAGGLKVMVNAPKAGDPAFLWDIGETKVVAGAAITAGAIVMSDSSGRVITFVNNGSNVPIGEARMAAVNAGDVITCFMFPNPTAIGALTGFTSATALTAVGTNQATALQLTAQINQVTTGATTTGVNLPAAVAGAICEVINDVGNSFHVYAAQGASDTIDGAAAGTGVVIGAGSLLRVLFTCHATGKWVSLAGQKST